MANNRTILIKEVENNGNPLEFRNEFIKEIAKILVEMTKGKTSIQ